MTITSLTGDKRRLEAELPALQSELEDALAARRAAEERADRAQGELARLADELRLVSSLSYAFIGSLKVQTKKKEHPG